MDFGSINFVGVLIAFLVNFVIGFIWFGPKTFFPIWWKAIGKTGDPGEGANMTVVFASTAIAGLVSATGLALVVDLVSRLTGDVNLLTGLFTGLITGVFIMAAPALSHRLFAGNGFKVWALEIGSDVLGFVGMGIVLSFFY